MKTFVFLCCVVALCFNPLKGFSQNATIEITTAKSLSIENIFNLIKANTDYQFVYSYNLIKDAQKIYINKGDIAVKDLLKKGLDVISSTYEFKDNNTIIVKKKQVSTENTNQQNKVDLKTISGQITFMGDALPNVNIIILDSKSGAKTDAQGKYNIKASIEDILQYSYVGFKTVSIIVEDVTTVLNIEMATLVNELDEAVVIANGKRYAMTEAEKNRGKPFKTAVGMFHPEAFGYTYFDDKDNLGRFTSFTEAWSNIYANTDRDFPSVWDVDGIIYYNEPAIDLTQIIDIYIIGKIGSMRWGGNGAIIVRTKYGYSPELREARIKDSTAKYVNNNYYNDDAVIVNNESTLSSISTVNTQNTKAIPKDISGKVTYLAAPLPNVNIIIVGKTTGAKTNNLGKYTIKAVVGDIIQYSYLGFATVSIIIEDVTEILNIEMFTNTNQLDEVLVTAKNSSGKVMERAKKAEEKFITSRGNIDPIRATYPISFVNGEEILPIYPSLTKALNGKMAGVTIHRGTGKIMVKPLASMNTPIFAIWDIDGQIFIDEPPINLNNIKDIHILKTLSATNRYGSAGAGGVIVVRTKSGTFNPAETERKKITEQYTNKNYYSNDASVVNLDDLSSNSFADALEAFNSKQKAYLYYDQTLKKMVNSYSDYISIAQKFITYYKDINLSKQVLSDLAVAHNKDTEILKAIAYQFQTLGLKREAIKAYEQIFKLRPKYAQSYRDLANAYLENDQYKKAWRQYMSYLMQGHDVSGEGIGQILYNEMEFLYYNRRQQTAIKETFIPKSDNLFDFRNDVRFVFEWNTSEAEFDLEFVNQEKRVYVFEHSLSANQELITNEKQKGYSSKEFFIDDIGDGEWLVNITYKGNKKPEPTYFKVTQYYNWGKANQTREIRVYKFQNEREKMQLITLNKQQLVASN